MRKRESTLLSTKILSRMSPQRCSLLWWYWCKLRFHVQTIFWSIKQILMNTQINRWVSWIRKKQDQRALKVNRKQLQVLSWVLNFHPLINLLRIRNWFRTKRLRKVCYNLWLNRVVLFLTKKNWQKRNNKTSIKNLSQRKLTQ